MASRAKRLTLISRCTFSLSMPKADCYFLRNTPHDRAAFARRVQWPFAEAKRGTVWLYAPEDVILMKLVYYRMSQGVSTKHLRDIMAMLAHQAQWGRVLELNYLKEWAVQLQVLAYWDKLWSDFQANLKARVT